MPSYKTTDFIAVIPGTGGIIATIAERVGCDWHTAKKYISNYATVQQAYQDECERISDMATSAVLKAIRDGDVPTAKWWLSKKRKGEFGDAVDVTSGSKPIVFKVIDESE